jgi:hypothetical protein
VVIGVVGIGEGVLWGLFSLSCRYFEKIIPHFWHSTPLDVCSKPHFGHFMRLNPLLLYLNNLQKVLPADIGSRFFHFYAKFILFGIALIIDSIKKAAPQSGCCL